MNQHIDEGDLERLNRLLERLHQAGYAQHGSTVFIYAPGSRYVEKQFNIGKTLPDQKSELKIRNSQPSNNKFDGTEELPEVLATDKAMVLWQKVQRAGYVDEDYQPLLSRTQAALLADAMAERLGIKEKWKVFEGLWHRKYMRSDYNLALTRKQSLDFQDELKRLFG